MIESEKQFLCKHETFDASTGVARLLDSGSFMLEISIKCADCNMPFHFNGLACGLDMNGARISVDGLEARLSIAPGLGGLVIPTE